MKKKILEFIRKYQMIRPGDSVCVGFSGGADSVCLLELLYELREELSIRLEAVHVNHNLRGRESDGDQDFAEEFCRKRGIPLHLYSFEVKKMAGNLGCGLEEAGRQARRNAYGDCVRRLGGARIALAHHQNDLAETLLFHLSRGTSLEGMAALRPVRGQVIRPLLCVSRKEIKEELRRRGLSWRTDSSNLTDDYTRNCIRHQVIPVLEERVNRKAAAHIAAAGEEIPPDERKDICRRDFSIARISLSLFSSSSFDSIRISRIMESSTPIFGYSAFPFISNVARNSFSFTFVTSV